MTHKTPRFTAADLAGAEIKRATIEVLAEYGLTIDSPYEEWPQDMALLVRDWMRRNRAADPRRWTQ
jgi:hypothetical protein